MPFRNLFLPVCSDLALLLSTCYAKKSLGRYYTHNTHKRDGAPRRPFSLFFFHLYTSLIHAVQYVCIMLKTIHCETKGWCHTCEHEHVLHEGNARLHALSLMDELEKQQRIDLTAPASHANPTFSTDYLFGPALGQMFGVLECIDATGQTHILRAFSCQYNSRWLIEGWVPPLFNIDDYSMIMDPADQAIKALGRQIDALPRSSNKRKTLTRERKALSQKTMKELHSLYSLSNFRGQTASLVELFASERGIPTGTGDCCAPKLLNYAAQNGFKPIGLCEFYWGADNSSGTRKHRHFYSSCRNKCYPILGFLLCGADKYEPSS
jgi:hypothetical protein